MKGIVLEDRLGGSSHTAVYSARARGGRELAVKIVDSELEPETGLWERLRRDAGLLSEIGHPDILPIQEAGRSEGLTFAATPLVRAPSLQDLMGRGQMDNESAWSILSQIADALDTVHYRGLVCRLLKPVNILVDGRGQVYLAEFGMASKRVGPLALSTPGYRLNGPQYLAPEQVEGDEPDWRADIYALAVLIFEILTHTPLQPLGRSLSETLRATMLGPTPSAQARQPDLPPGVDWVLSRAMSKDPRDRHTSAWQLLDELVNLGEEAAPAPSPAARPESAPGMAAVPMTPAPADPLVMAPPVVAPVAVGGAGVLQATASSSGQLAVTKARHPQNSMVAFLQRMGVPVFEGHRQLFLNSYFAALVRFGRQACGERWIAVLQAAGYEALLEEEPPDDNERTIPIGAASRLAEAIEYVFGPAAPETLRQWGRLTSEFWITKTQQLQEGSVTYMKPLRGFLSSADRKVEDVLYITSRNTDRIRGERLTAWKQIDKHQFWTVHYDNLMVLGRRRAASSCYFCTAALEAAMRWGGLANDWIVEEAECGSVTGTFDCIFTVKRVMR